MKKINLHPSFLQVIYLATFVVLFGFVVYIPRLISNPLHITNRIILEEEVIEGSLLGLLFFLNILILNLYRKESVRQKEVIKKIDNARKSAEAKLDDSFRYIGQVNVQLQQIKSIFNNNSKLPETKNDFKKALFFFGERVFGIVSASWVLFRIINCNTQKTIREQFEIRRGFNAGYPHVSNKRIIEEQCCTPFSTVISNPQNLDVLVCCVLPVDKISHDERVFIQAITNEITMLFVIYNSSWYKKGNGHLPVNISGKGN